MESNCKWLLMWSSLLNWAKVWSRSKSQPNVAKTILGQIILATSHLLSRPDLTTYPNKHMDPVKESHWITLIRLNVASPPYQVSYVSIQENTPLSLRTQSSCLRSNCESEDKVQQGVIWNPSFLDPNPKVSWPFNVLGAICTLRTYTMNIDRNVIFW